MNFFKRLKNSQEYYVKLYEKFCPFSVTFSLKRKLRECHSILDLGCGEGTFQILQALPKNCLKVGVEIYKHYIEKAKKKYDLLIYADARNPPFRDQAFWCVTAFHLIEHLDKDDGYHLIKEMERVTKKWVIIVCPNGFLEQDAYNGNPWIIHRSAWTPQEFKNLGFKVFGLNGLKYLRGYQGRIKLKPAPLWRIISDLSQIFTYFFPGSSAALLCIKEVRRKGEGSSC